ncbi:hypothetical protein IRJ41_008138 [Triplophysa rosa]|uniref:Uncharacterized protein n=1 Tax=Triplophysa rosa TaxID=992332 RepID=A0A9W7X346_TRIRA|nr:hypothetical protein IRJ41_008138 [Triplophysa rosa]
MMTPEPATELGPEPATGSLAPSSLLVTPNSLALSSNQLLTYFIPLVPPSSFFHVRPVQLLGPLHFTDSAQLPGSFSFTQLNGLISQLLNPPPLMVPCSSFGLTTHTFHLYAPLWSNTTQAPLGYFIPLAPSWSLVILVSLWTSGPPSAIGPFTLHHAPPSVCLGFHLIQPHFHLWEALSVKDVWVSSNVTGILN